MLLSKMQIVDVKFFGSSFPGAPNEPDTTFVSDGGEHVLEVGNDGRVVSIENLTGLLEEAGFRFAEVTNKTQTTRSGAKRTVVIFRFTRDGKGAVTKGGGICPEFPRVYFDAFHIWLNPGGTCTMNGAHWSTKAPTHEIVVQEDGALGLEELPLGPIE